MPNTDKESKFNWTIIFVCWIIASVSTLGSLFFSEIMELPPCALCWYQRVFMFPLVIVFLIGLFPFDKSIIKYAFPLALTGWGFAFYHYLLYTGFIPESIQPCSQGVSCSETYLACWFLYILAPSTYNRIRNPIEINTINIFFI